MEITPMEKTSNQIHGLSKCYLGITYYLSTPKTVATGHEKSVTANSPLNSNTYIFMKITYYWYYESYINFCINFYAYENKSKYINKNYDESYL